MSNFKKEQTRSFGSKEKEPVIDRIFQLVDRYPSRSQAARAWGMNISTLQNYYKRKDIEPTPRKAHLLKIAEKEQVSLDWLLTGEGEIPDFKKSIKNEMNKKELIIKQGVSNELIDLKIMELLSFLSKDEKERIMEVLVRKGVETVLYLLDPSNQALLELREDKKRVALRMDSMLEEQFREILSKIEISTEDTISKVEHSNANIRARA